MAVVQIDRCDQLTHYLTKLQAPSSAKTAASNGPSTEVATIDGYKVRGHLVQLLVHLTAAVWRKYLYSHIEQATEMMYNL